MEDVGDSVISNLCGVTPPTPNDTPQLTQNTPPCADRTRDL